MKKFFSTFALVSMILANGSFVLAKTASGKLQSTTKEENKTTMTNKNKKITLKQFVKKYEKAIPLYQAAQMFLLAQDIDQVLNIAEKLIKTYPEFYPAYEINAKTLYDYSYLAKDLRETYTTALENAFIAIEYAPADKDYMSLYGLAANILYELDKYNEALTYYTKAIEEGSKNNADNWSLEEYYFERGNIYALLNQYDNALADYAKIDEYSSYDELVIANTKIVKRLKHGDKNIRIHLKHKAQDCIEGVFIIHEANSDIQSLDAWIKYIKNLMPNSAFTYYLQARFENIKGNYKEALLYCDKALEADDLYLKVYKEKSDIYFKQKNYDKALECIDKYIALIPVNMTQANDDRDKILHMVK